MKTEVHFNFIEWQNNFFIKRLSSEAKVSLLLLLSSIETTQPDFYKNIDEFQIPDFCLIQAFGHLGKKIRTMKRYLDELLDNGIIIKSSSHTLYLNLDFVKKFWR